MAQKQFKPGDKITAPDALAHQLILNMGRSESANYDHFIATIEVLSTVTGIAFTTGKEPDADSHKYQTGDKLILSFFPGQNDIYYKADNLNDTFVICV